MKTKILALSALAMVAALSACAHKSQDAIRDPAQDGPGRFGDDRDHDHDRFRFGDRHRDWDRQFDPRRAFRGDCRVDQIRQMPVDPRMYVNDGEINLNQLMNEPGCRGREILGVSVLAFEPDNFLIRANGREFGDGRPDRFEWVDLPGAPGRWGIELRQLSLRIADFKNTNIASVRLILGGQPIPLPPPPPPPPPPRLNPVPASCQFSGEDNDAKAWENSSCDANCPAGMHPTNMIVSNRDKDGPCEIQQSDDSCKARYRSKDRGKNCKVKFSCDYVCVP